MDPAHPDPGFAGAAPLFLLLVVVPLGVWAAYVVAAMRARATGTFSAWRIASFTAGTALLVAAMVPPVSVLAHHDLRGHMAQHLLLGMYAPLGLVLGAPGTLLLRSLPARAARGLIRALGTRVVRVFVHPVTALVWNVGGMYLLYLTPLFVLSTNHAGVHVWVHLHFVVGGCIFTWAIAGPDPAPHRPGFVPRLAVLLVGAGTHATLAKLMYAYELPAGTPHDPEQILAAAQWMYYGGDIAELLLMIAFFTAWFRRRAVTYQRSVIRQSSTRPTATQAGAHGDCSVA